MERALHLKIEILIFRGVGSLISLLKLILFCQLPGCSVNDLFLRLYIHFLNLLDWLRIPVYRHLYHRAIPMLFEENTRTVALLRAWSLEDICQGRDFFLLRSKHSESRLEAMSSWLLAFLRNL